MSKRPTTIWIVNEAGHDYEKARDLFDSNIKFSYLTENEINPHHVDRLAKHIAKGVIKYARKEDYVLVSGTPMVNVLAIWIWLLFHKECNVLQWDAKSRAYRKSTLREDATRNMMQKILES